MNERIKELMLEAGYAAPEIAGRAHKLSELIVQECANLDFRVRVGLSSDQDYDVSNAIRQHFGVE